MSHKIISSEENVQNFIIELKKILSHPNFNIGEDLDLLLKKKSEYPTEPYTTVNTLLALDFDKHDVFNQLMSLEISEYMETFIDDLDNSLQNFMLLEKRLKAKMFILKLRFEIDRSVKYFVYLFTLQDIHFQSVYRINIMIVETLKERCN